MLRRIRIQWKKVRELHGGYASNSNEEDDAKEENERDAETVFAVDLRDEVRRGDVDGGTSGEWQSAEDPVGQEVDDEDARNGGSGQEDSGENGGTASAS